MLDSLPTRDGIFRVSGRTQKALHRPGMYVDIRRYHWGITLWSQYNPMVTPHVTALAKNLGGRWKRAYRNWAFKKGEYIYQALYCALTALESRFNGGQPR